MVKIRLCALTARVQSITAALIPPLLLLGTLLTAALTPSMLLAAPSASVTAELSARSGTLDDVLTWAIIAHETSDVAPPTIEETADFEIRYRGPQSSVQIINGDIQRELRFIYHLVPRREGRLLTPHASVTAAGKTYEVAPLEVEISKGTTRDDKKIDGVAVEQSVDKNSVYIGQQLTNTIEILTDRQLVEPQFGDLTFDGFRHLDIGEDQRTTRLVRGRPMTVITLKKALYPIRTGELTIASRELRAKMRVSGSNRSGFQFDFSDPFGSGLFDDFFGGGALREIRVSSDPLSISVKPLPPKPDGLSSWGALDTLVGHTGIYLKISTDPLAFGESRAMTIEVTSEGNIAPVTSIPFPPSPGYKIYQDPPETRVYDSDGTIVTRKNFKASLVPLVGGPIRIPPVALSYFDPTTGEYKTTRSNGIEIEVTGGPQPTPTAAGGAPEISVDPNLDGATERYEPLGLVERLGRHVSLPLALLIATIVVVLLALVRIGAKRRGVTAESSRLWGAVERSTSPEELRSALLRAMSHDLEIVGPESRHGIGDEIKRRHLPSDLDFAFQTVCDNVDRALYSGDKDSPSLDSIRSAALSLRSALPRR